MSSIESKYQLLTVGWIFHQVPSQGGNLRGVYNVNAWSIVRLITGWMTDEWMDQTITFNMLTGWLACYQEVCSQQVCCFNDLRFSAKPAIYFCF